MASPHYGPTCAVSACSGTRMFWGSLDTKMVSPKKCWSLSFSGSVYYRIILMYKAQNENNNDNNIIITETPNFREN